MLDHYSSILPTKSSLFCKIRTYLVTLIPALATYYTSFASIDGFLLTSRSVNCPAWSNIKVARYSVVITTVILLFSSIHILIYYNVKMINAENNVFLCIPRDGIYTFFVSIYFIVCFLIIPCVMMIISSILTYMHIKKSQRHSKTLPLSRKRTCRLDRHLLIMMLVQVSLSLIFLSFRIVNRTYSILTTNVKNNNYRIAIESFTNELSFVMYTLNFAKSFVVYTLTSRLFFEIFCERIMGLYRTILTMIKRISSQSKNLHTSSVLNTMVRVYHTSNINT
ncbi:unnamed protein product [Rotaria sp. Silwood2]|nr:unnamed protein product [Rotaria sp. Silwood2]